MDKINVNCPCCETAFLIDGKTGAVISHEEKDKKLSSFEDLTSDLNKRKERASQLFSQEQATQKDRQRILEEKFQDAMKKADHDSAEPFRNPLDMD